MSYRADVNIGRSVSRRVEVVSVEDDGEIQKVTVMGLADEYFELSFRAQGHGLSTVPIVGSVGYLHMANGRPDQAFLTGLEHPAYRPKDQVEGEAMVYAKQGQTMHFDDDGNVIVRTPGGIYHVNPP